MFEYSIKYSIIQILLFAVFEYRFCFFLDRMAVLRSYLYYCNINALNAHCKMPCGPYVFILLCYSFLSALVANKGTIINVTVNVDAAYCYRPSSVVSLTGSLSLCHSNEPCKNG